MVLRREDSVQFEAVLDDGQSVSGQRAEGALEVSTSKSDSIKIFVDNGMTGGQPSSYNMYGDERKSNESFSGWLRERHVEGSTDRRWTLENVSSNTYRVDLEDSSGGTGNTYRVFVESVYNTD